jgi:diguanylate cyclase (GGDEF)-like protein
VIRFDIDEFKRVNDKHGHATGDLVLQVFGRVCEETRPVDTVAGRLGGDEFVILSTRMEPSKARILAERIRAHFAAACSEETEGAVQVGLSAGVSSVPLDLGLDEALEIADRAMYEAKASGRGKTVVGSAEKARVFSGAEEPQFAFYNPHPA